jgi:hypothetical protein
MPCSERSCFGSGALSVGSKNWWPYMEGIWVHFSRPLTLMLLHELKGERLRCSGNSGIEWRIPPGQKLVLQTAGWE